MTRPSPKDWITKEALLLLQGWARDGLTDEQIANNMGVSVRSLYRWKKMDDEFDEYGNVIPYSQIRQSLKTGKEAIDYAVENALVKAALSGNVTAMIFWLKNRKPGKWRERPDPVMSDELMALARNVIVSIKDKAEDDGRQDDQSDEEAS